jgi:hypothetical protein
MNAILEQMLLRTGRRVMVIGGEGGLAGQCERNIGRIRKKRKM